MTQQEKLHKKSNFVKKTGSMLHPVEIFEISRAIAQVTPEMLGATEIEILSTSTVKRLVVEQGRYLKRE